MRSAVGRRAGPTAGSRVLVSALTCRGSTALCGEIRQASSRPAITTCAVSGSRRLATWSFGSVRYYYAEHRRARRILSSPISAISSPSYRSGRCRYWLRPTSISTKKVEKHKKRPLRPFSA